MKFWTTIYLFLCLAASLAAQISAPKVGVARYADHSVRAIYGLPAAFLVGERLTAPADAISFSDSGGLVSRGGKIQLVRRDGSVVTEHDSGETAPVLNIDGDLTTAIAWLPSRHALLHWNGRSFVLTPLTSAISENVTSLHVQSAHSAKLLLATPDGHVLEATVSLDTGDLMSINPLPGVRAPAVQQYSFLVFHDKRGLEIQSADGTLRSISLPASDLTIERMSSDFLHLVSSATQRSWVLHLTAASLNLSLLPALPEAAK